MDALESGDSWKNICSKADALPERIDLWVFFYSTLAQRFSIYAVGKRGEEKISGNLCTKYISHMTIQVSTCM